MGITGEQQMFEKSNKSIAVFVAGDEVADLGRLPIECAKNMTIGGCARSRDGLALASSHPAAP